MGKNRKANPIISYDGGLIFSPPTYPETYKTEAGVEVKGHGLSETDLGIVQGDINSWVGNEWVHTPDEVFTRIEQLQFIENSMETTSNSLTRVEPIGKGRNITLSQLKSYKKNLIGKKIKLGGHLKAFSRTRDATDKFLKEHFSTNQPLVIFKTEGNVRHFDVNKWNKLIPWEKESWVSSGEWEITGVKNISKQYNKNPNSIVNDRTVYEITIKQSKDDFKEVHNSPKIEEYHARYEDNNVAIDKWVEDRIKFEKHWIV